MNPWLGMSVSLLLTVILIVVMYVMYLNVFACHPSSSPPPLEPTHLMTLQIDSNDPEAETLYDKRQALIRMEDQRVFRFNFNTAFTVSDGIRLPRLDDDVVVLYVSGSWSGLFCQYPTWRRRLPYPGAFGPSWPFKMACLGLFPVGAMVVGFEFPTQSLAHLNFGGRLDCQVLNQVYQRLQGRPVVVMAGCLGALKVLRWLQWYRPTSIRALVLETPLLNVDAWLGPSLHRLLRGVLPTYRKDPPVRRLVPTSFVAYASVPVLMAFVTQDPAYSSDSHEQLLQCFPHAQTFVFTASHYGSSQSDVRHGCLWYIPEYKQALQAFWTFV